MSDQPRNIQERTFVFGVNVIAVVNRLPRTTAGLAVGQQLVRAGTSVGANMQEADEAESGRDFAHKTGIALKEAKEAHYWLRMAEATLLPADDVIRALIREAREVVLILAAIRRKAMQNPRRSRLRA